MNNQQLLPFMFWPIKYSLNFHLSSRKLLPKLRSGSDLMIGIDFSASMETGIAKSFETELKQILDDLGLSDRIKIE